VVYRYCSWNCADALDWGNWWVFLSQEVTPTRHWQTGRQGMATTPVAPPRPLCTDLMFVESPVVLSPTGHDDDDDDVVHVDARYLNSKFTVAPRQSVGVINDGSSHLREALPDSAKSFLIAMGFIIPSQRTSMHPVLRALCIAYCTINRFSLILAGLLAIYLPIDVLGSSSTSAVSRDDDYNANVNVITIWSIFCGALLFQMITILPSIRNSYKRLDAPPESKYDELSCYGPSVAIAWRYFWPCMLCAWVFPLLNYALFFRHQPFDWQQMLFYLFIFLAEVSATNYLCVSMLFIIVDAKAATALVRKLFNEAKDQSLTLEKFESTRQDVALLVNKTLYTNACIVIVAFVNSICVIISIFPFIQNGYVYLVLFVKELFFLVIVFFEVSKVNEKADELTLYLSSSTWTMEGHAEMSRLSLCINAMNRPISFKLGGIRITRLQVLVQIVVFVAASVISAIRSAIVNIPRSS
jgi:hypothetical protein